MSKKSDKNKKSKKNDQRKKSAKKKNSRSSLSRWLLLMVLLAAGILLYQYAFNRQHTPVHTREQPVPPAFLSDGTPVGELVATWHKTEQLDLDAIHGRLPDHFRVIVLGEDITANQLPNYLIIRTELRGPRPDRDLRRAGFTQAFRDLVLYELRDNTLHPILTIDSDAIRDSNGNTLIAQVPARHGYALLLEEYFHDRLYESPVQLIEIIMLDDQGEGASDEIVIYWDPSENAFKATNTFGAP